MFGFTGRVRVGLPYRNVPRDDAIVIDLYLVLPDLGVLGVSEEAGMHVREVSQVEEVLDGTRRTTSSELTAIGG